MTVWNVGYEVDELSELLDPDVCPNVAQAMGPAGMLRGYPLFTSIEARGDLNSGPEEPDPNGDYDYDEEGDYSYL